MSIKSFPNDISVPPKMEELHQMIKSCGPVLNICSEEKYLPTSIEQFVESCRLTDHGNGRSCTKVTADTLPTGSDSRGCVLELKDEESGFVVDFSRTKAYVKAEVVDDNYTNLHFWFFHAFRSDVSAKVTNVTASKRPLEIPLISEKVGHWDVITLRFDNSDLTQPHSARTCENGLDTWMPFSECDTNGRHLVVYSSALRGLSLRRESPNASSVMYKNAIGDSIRVDLSNEATPSDAWTLDCSVKYEILNEPGEPNWTRFEGRFGPDCAPCVTSSRDIRLAIQKYSNPWPEFLPRIVHPYDGKARWLKNACKFDRVTFKSVSDILSRKCHHEKTHIGPLPDGPTMRSATAA